MLSWELGKLEKVEMRSWRKSLPGCKCGKSSVPAPGPNPWPADDRVYSLQDNNNNNKNAMQSIPLQLSPFQKYAECKLCKWSNFFRIQF